MAQGGPHRDGNKEQFWRELISRQPSSGLSIRGYCRRHRLRETAFYFWRRELARRAGAKTSAAFVPVSVTPDAAACGPGACIEILLAGGRQLRLHGPVDRRSLIDVLAVLEGTSC